MKRPDRLLARVLVLGCLLLAASGAAAVVVDHIERGYWTDTGFSNTARLAYVPTGPDDGFGDTLPFSPNFAFVGATDFIVYRGYLVFDLGSLAGPVSAGTLNMELQAVVGQSPIKTLQVRHFIGGIEGLRTPGIARDGIFTVLGQGTVIGSLPVSAADAGTLLSITLDSAGLDIVNAARGGLLAFGLNGGFINDEIDDALVFGPSGPIARHFLDLTLAPVSSTSVDGPGTLLLALCGGLLLLTRRRARAG